MLNSLAVAFLPTQYGEDRLNNTPMDLEIPAIQLLETETFVVPGNISVHNIFLI